MEKFKLNSPFQPTGDQPEAIAKLITGLQRGDKHQSLLGATGTGKTFTIANVVNQVQKPTLVIAHNKTLAAQLASEFREFFPTNAVEYFVSYYDYYQPESYVPQIDLYIEKDASINQEIDRLRLAATKSLMTRRDVLIVASVSCIYGLGSPTAYKKSTINLFKKQKIALTEVARRLTELQYERNNLDLKRGTFRIKGDLLEVFPAYEQFVVRISFFGDEIEKISQVNSTSFEVEKELPEILVFPTRHYQMEDEDVATPLSQIREELADRLKYLKSKKKLVEAQRLEQRTKYDLEMMENIGYCNGIENYSRYFDHRKAGEPPYTLIDYFPEDFLLVIDESHMSLPQLRAMWHGEKARKSMLIDYGFRLPSAMDNRPLTFDEFSRKTNQVIYTSATPQQHELSMSTQVVEQIIRPTGIVDPEVEIRKTKGQIDNLISEIQQTVKKGERVLVTTLTKRMAEDLTEYLQERDIKVMYIHHEVDTLERIEVLRDLRRGIYDVLVGVNLLREGLDLPEVSLVAILDADKEGFLRSRTSLIQTIGRAARRVNGRVIMYADTITGSMKQAIDETDRRRAIQVKSNEEHGITPKTIEKAVHDIGERLSEIQPEAETVEELDLTKVPKDQIKRLVIDLEKAMKLAAENLEFERAALIRDQLVELKKEEVKVPKTISAAQAKKLRM
ncbi:MAG: excinuclease ABC subunit B [Candidatus Woykebacteria bacterium RIFCSPHIGHO2_12_FULL_45_10]|uniref:UvrABC system protein B n=1 Tax=Candidatus Woykebacteria bacterium RIFCSPHIGHO2_12_FULL_45_10 TaxID=1802603 RepID=A0A1G1WMV8_9BACT|nr:MAG: excinuclease ABC subunit B [Candidatus Woykebacteria bacterium RIFCSPHIGHO2_12_FULL_45_10]